SMRDMVGEMLGFEQVASRGSRTASYEKVGNQIGKSSKWVRRFVGRDRCAALSLQTGLNIAARYRELYERIERENKTRRERLAELEGRTHALDSRAGNQRVSADSLPLAIFCTQG